MNYTLNSNRIIGDNFQNCTIEWEQAQKASSVSTLTQMQRWRNALLTLDPSGRTVSSFLDHSFTETQSGADYNTGDICDAKFTLLTSDETPVTVNFEVNNIPSPDDLFRLVNASVIRLINLNVNHSSVYVTNVTMTLHK